ncbi:hypothetical protein [Jannaschia sp. R86511]|uniref:hypothetical protein n=1 Tax=Jannaschia sp. R86511 TaxID=3093853 RepID=UPI0036D30C0F
MPLLEAAEASVTGLEESSAESEADVADLAAALASAQEDLAATEAAVTTAEDELAAARDGGDADEIEAAEQALAEAEQARDDDAAAVQEAQEALTAAELAADDLLLELDQARGERNLLIEAALGRDFETEQSLADHLADLRALGLDEYAGLVQAAADACDWFAEDAGAPAPAVVAPSAPAATPVTARASYTG